jgi:hypothetical protein
MEIVRKKSTLAYCVGTHLSILRVPNTQNSRFADLCFKWLNPKEKPKRLTISCHNVDTNFDFERQHPNFCMGASRSCTTKFWPVLYFIIEMLFWKFHMNLFRKSKTILKKPETTQIFVWEPIKGYQLEPRCLTWTSSRP